MIHLKISIQCFAIVKFHLLFLQLFFFFFFVILILFDSLRFETQVQSILFCFLQSRCFLSWVRTLHLFATTIFYFQKFYSCFQNKTCFQFQFLCIYFQIFKILTIILWMIYSTDTQFAIYIASLHHCSINSLSLSIQIFNFSYI